MGESAAVPLGSETGVNGGGRDGAGGAAAQTTAATPLAPRPSIASEGADLPRGAAGGDPPGFQSRASRRSRKLPAPNGALARRTSQSSADDPLCVCCPSGVLFAKGAEVLPLPQT
jgi:hypothetical protein